jgi:ribulose-phosphate 3-epimerase
MGIFFINKLLYYYRNFVPNLTIGPPVVKALKKNLKEVYFDCHIMVTHPKNYIQELK